MALNVPGLVATLIFYALVLAIGVWASVKSRRDEARTQARHADMALLGNRRISLVVGVFTTTGESAPPRLCSDRRSPTVENVVCGSLNPVQRFKWSSWLRSKTSATAKILLGAKKEAVWFSQKTSLLTRLVDRPDV